MSSYLGDFTTSNTVYVYFNTFDSNDPSASVTLTGLAVGDIKIYKDGSVTQRASTSGFTLLDTDGTDFDGVTGIHGFSIDLSDNTDAGFYAAGSEYEVVVDSVTVDAATISFTAAKFSIERSGGALALLKDATFGLSAIETLVDDIESRLTAARAGYLDNLNGHTAQTGDSYARLGAPAGASVSADIAAIDSNVDAILVDTGTTLDTKLNDIQGATFNSSTDSLEAIRDRGDAAWTTGAGGSDRLLMVDTTIATLSTQTSFTLTAGSADDDAYNNCTIVIEDASTATQKAVGMVLDYTGSTKTVALKEALAFTVATTDKVYILAENSLKSTIANRQLDVTATGAAGIDWANVENPTTAVDLSATDIQLCDTVTVNTDMRGTDNAFLAASAPTNFSDLSIAATTGLVDITQAAADKAWNTTTRTLSAATNITSDGSAVTMSSSGVVGTVNLVNTTTTNTDMRGTDSAATASALATVDTNVDAILVDTGTTIPAQITALNDVSVSDILTTQMTESYAADGTAPTLAQALMLIQQSIGDFAIAGTTITVKKLDGSTAAATYTLDDGTSPTSRTRSS